MRSTLQEKALDKSEVLCFLSPQQIVAIPAVAIRSIRLSPADGVAASNTFSKHNCRGHCLRPQQQSFLFHFTLVFGSSPK